MSAQSASPRRTLRILLPTPPGVMTAAGCNESTAIASAFSLPDGEATSTARGNFCLHRKVIFVEGNIIYIRTPQVLHSHDMSGTHSSWSTHSIENTFYTCTPIHLCPLKCWRRYVFRAHSCESAHANHTHTYTHAHKHTHTHTDM
jgi:hypothetical protein